MALRQQRNNTIVLMKHQVCFAMRWRGKSVMRGDR